MQLEAKKQRLIQLEKAVQETRELMGDLVPPESEHYPDASGDGPKPRSSISEEGLASVSLEIHHVQVVIDLSQSQNSPAAQVGDGVAQREARTRTYLSGPSLHWWGRSRHTGRFPWFSTCQSFVCLLLWFVFACQTSSYTQVSEFCRNDDGAVLQLWVNNEKNQMECEQECTARNDCKAIAWVSALQSRCALLSAYHTGTCLGKIHDEWFWVQHYKKGGGGIKGILSAKAGLDSIFPGKTVLEAHHFCEESYGYEILWRLMSYQFTHGGVLHVGGIVLMIFALGIPLEGSLNTLNLFFMFNLGVIGGGLNWLCFDPHRVTFGASGGCYALLGIHVADIMMNWSQTKFRYILFGFLIFIGILDIILVSVGTEDASGLRPSYTTHYGGVVTGIISGVFAVPKSVTKDQSNIRVLRWVLFGVGLAFLVISVMWWLTNPLPGVRDLWGPSDPPRCWQGQGYISSKFAGKNQTSWGCVACSTRECVEGWYEHEFSLQIGYTPFSQCQTVGVLDGVAPPGLGR